MDIENNNSIPAEFWQTFGGGNPITVSIAGSPDDLIEIILKAPDLGFDPKVCKKHRLIMPFIAAGSVTAIALSGDETAIENLYRAYGDRPGMYIKPVLRQPTPLLRTALEGYVEKILKKHMSRGVAKASWRKSDKMQDLIIARFGPEAKLW